MQKLRTDQYRNSTKRNYYCVWKSFNNFFIKLDRKPRLWEDRIVLFVAYLIKNNKKSMTVKSYISAIKAGLTGVNIHLCQDEYLLKSLTKACKLKNDKFRIRLPIQKGMLQILIRNTIDFYSNNGQRYLAILYSTMMSTAYYGLFRIGEITYSDHLICAANVHVASNKKKLLFVLTSSKTHLEGSTPQTVKISSFTTDRNPVGPVLQHKNSPLTVEKYCPYSMLQQYIKNRKNYKSDSEPFFIFRDRFVILPYVFAKVFKNMIHISGFDNSIYSAHSLQAGRSLDLLEMGFSVETIRKLGRWKSNAIYNYLKY